MCSFISINLIMKVLRNMNNIDIPFDGDVIDAVNTCFYRVCVMGRLDDAQWIWERWSKYIRVHECDEILFRGICECGRLGIAKWLWEVCSQSKTPIDINADNYGAFHVACETCNVEIADWILDIYPVDIYQLIYIIPRIGKAFGQCCEKNKLRLAKLLWKRWHKEIIAANIYEIFGNTCEKSNLSVIKWMWNIHMEKTTSRGGLDRYQDKMFNTCCERGNINIVNWIITLSDKYWYEKDAAGTIINWYGK